MTAGRRPRHTPLAPIFIAPLVIAVLSLIGLVSALTGDGWRDGLAWIGLAVPILAVIWAAKARRV